MNIKTTANERIMLNETSLSVRVNIDVEPKRVEQTSPDKFEEVEKIFISKYPTAKEPTDNMATAASPLIVAFFPVFNNKTAHMTVTKRTTGILFVMFNTAAIAIAPNAT